MTMLHSRPWLLLLILLALMLAAAVLGLALGTVNLSLSQLAGVLAHHLGSSSAPVTTLDLVVWDIRLPRVLLSLLVGMALAVSGALVQGLFRNPLADPSLIGVSGGADRC